MHPAAPPRAQFHGFRFVEITGLPTPPTLSSITGLFLRSALPIIGNTAFPPSANYLNSVQHASEWGVGSNLNGVISDCCQRDERKVRVPRTLRVRALAS